MATIKLSAVRRRKTGKISTRPIKSLTVKGKLSAQKIDMSPTRSALVGEEAVRFMELIRSKPERLTPMQLQAIAEYKGLVIKK